MSDNAAGYSASSDAERIQALQGHVQALEIAIIQMMRVITRGQQGEEAYQALSQGLLADADGFRSIPMLNSKSTAVHLDMLSSIFGRKPET